MNYTELTDLITDYTSSLETTFVANIPVFIRQAEERILRSVMIPELRKNVTGTATTGNRYLARPSDILTVFSICVVDSDGNYAYLRDKDVNFMREAYPNPAVTGQPQYYGTFEGDSDISPDGNFLLAPTPDQEYAVELYYYYEPPSIVDSATSWLGDNAESVLLYGTLIEAYTFLKGDADLMALYSERYKEALRELRTLATRGARDDYNDGRAGGGV
jgi:hypothetical protein